MNVTSEAKKPQLPYSSSYALNVTQKSPKGEEPDKDACLSAALEYAAEGFRVLPVHRFAYGACTCGKRCTTPGKHPCIVKWQDNATTDPTRIRAWFSKWKDANVGIATGSASGLFVIDVDGEDGTETLRKLVANNGDLPSTRTAATGKGRHLFFRHPGGKVASTAGKLGPGLDVRGDGGFVVAAPSIHANGTVYRWERDGEISAAPDWLVWLVTQHPEIGTDTSCKAGQVPDEHPAIFEGQRNTTLASIGGRLRARGEEQDEIAAELLAINAQDCVPPLPNTEVEKIARSVSRYEANTRIEVGRRLRSDENPLFYFPFNISEWCSDQEIFFMNDRQVGWYIWLLVECWKQAGVLPVDRASLAKYARASSTEDFQKNCEPVLKKFEPATRDGEPVLVHPQMSKLWAEKYAAWLQKVSAGKKSAEVRRKIPSLSFAS